MQARVANQPSVKLNAGLTGVECEPFSDVTLKRLHKKCSGAFFGCLVGDALGAPAEFKRRGTFPEIRHMVPCTHFNLPPGSFTDDGSMMLCLSASMTANRGRHDPFTELTNYSKWMQNGYMSSSKRYKCFDVGGTVRRALIAFCNDNQLEASTSDDDFAGNGSLMRIAPVPIFWHQNIRKAWAVGEATSKTTHTNAKAVWSCGFFSALCGLAIQGSSKRELLRFARLHYKTDMLRNFEHKNYDDISTSGYVLDTLEAVLWAFFKTESFEEGLVLLVNMGDDADTVAAVFGTLAGAHYGIGSIPAKWLQALQQQAMIRAVFDELYNAAVHCWHKQLLTK